MRVRATSASVHYRGVDAPAGVGTTGNRLVTPWPRTQSAGAHTQLETRSAYPVSAVLRRSLAQWMARSVAATTGLQGARANADFQGIATVRGELKEVRPTSNVTLGPDGVVLFQGRRTFAASSYPVIVSARIDTTGTLETRDFITRTGYGQYAPLILGNSALVVSGVGGQAVSTHIAADGKFGATSQMYGVNDTGSTLIASDEVLSSALGDLVLRRFGATGKPEVIAHASVGPIDETCAPVLHNEHIVLFGRKNVQTLVRDGDTFAPVDKLEHAFTFDGTMYPPFITDAGLIVIGTSTGDLYAYEVNHSGKLRAIAYFPMGGEDRPPPVVYGDFIVTSDEDGHVRTLTVKNDAIVPVDAFYAGTAITARPTITRDGVVLVGTDDGNLFALQISPSGHLAKRGSNALGQPISEACTVTDNGVVIVPGKTSVFAVGGTVA
jgi:outer membrane protein assembly factor BamB